MLQMNYPFLITGFARSGTTYMAEVLKALGYKVAHEQYAPDGVVSYRHLPFFTRFDRVLHQTRHPLKVLSSCFTMEKTTYERVILLTSSDPNIPESEWLKRHMWAWVEWCEHADFVSNYRYQIEMFPKIYPEAFMKLNLPVPLGIPDVPNNTNSRKNDSAYRNLTWYDLEEADSYLCTRVRKLADVYGYSEEVA